MTYLGLDFDGDSRKAETCQDVDVKTFGPVNVTDFNKNTKSNVDRNNNIETIWKEEKELMIRCRNRIIKKVKDIRQYFSKAVRTRTT